MARSVRSALGCLLAGALVLGIATRGSAENWPGWRGPRGDGTSAEAHLPTHWSGSENVLWKTEIPGKGHASPIVWEDRIFVATCLEAEQSRLLLCYDLTGKELWRREVLKAPLEHKHSLNSFASSTPVTDGKLVYVTFLSVKTADNGRDPGAGEMVVAAYDYSGAQKWLVRPGRFSSVHGYCSSPVLFEDKVIVNGDHDGDSYLVALSRTTGDTIWKVNRANKTRSYSTPLIRDVAGRTQMVLCGSKCVTSFDPRTGKTWWTVQGPTEQFVASMVFNGEYFFLTAGFPEHHAMAIRPDGDGDVTKTHVAWWVKKDASCGYVPSPIICGEYFLIACDTGICTCYEAHSGERVWKERLGPHYSASLTTAEGLVYFLADDGVTKVIKPGKTLEVVAENKLGESCYASPAISAGRIYLRGEKHLFCIGAASN
ncbi:MAG TPA: PQQ-binding-like beta-propeller repeat protein [Pirellulales bacterium]|jgi:hypothetical protein|nr:PQQ-binding-like beta-propeller repeat protein [Pirellulales bacterium]